MSLSGCCSNNLKFGIADRHNYWLVNGLLLAMLDRHTERSQTLFVCERAFMKHCNQYGPANKRDLRSM